MHFNLPNHDLSSESKNNIVDDDDDESGDNHGTSSKLCEYIITQHVIYSFLNISRDDYHVSFNS